MAASPRFFTLSTKPQPKNPPRIEQKMTYKVPVDASGKHIMLNLLENLGVRTALPPDGGAAQAITVLSTTSFQVQTPLSYIPFRSINNLKSSIGGWAPYSSTEGMLMSSTNIAIFLPGGAPNNVLFFFSSFSSILYWVLAEVVWADILMLIGYNVPFSFI